MISSPQKQLCEAVFNVYFAFGAAPFISISFSINHSYAGISPFNQVSQPQAAYLAAFNTSAA